MDMDGVCVIVMHWYALDAGRFHSWSLIREESKCIYYQERNHT